LGYLSSGTPGAGLLSCFNDTICTSKFFGGSGVENIFLILAVGFSVGMMILMIKYAKFIHKQPKMEEERRKNTNKENPPPSDQI